MKNLFKDWTLFEKLWLTIFTLVIITVGIIFKDTTVGFIASISGVLCVVLVAQGKISNYLFGIINVLAYGYITYNAQLYGEAMLNFLFYLPLQFVGFYMWKKNMESETNTVKAKKLKINGWIGVVVTVAVVGVIYGIFLQSIGSQQANLDAFAVVLSITAQLLMLKRYAEQWILWILVNVITIVIWANVFVDSGNSVTILVMWIAYLVNSVWGYIKWNKLASEVKANV